MGGWGERLPDPGGGRRKNLVTSGGGGRNYVSQRNHEGIKNSPMRRGNWGVRPGEKKL